MRLVFRDGAEPRASLDTMVCHHTVAHVDGLRSRHMTLRAGFLAMVSARMAPDASLLSPVRVCVGIVAGSTPQRVPGDALALAHRQLLDVAGNLHRRIF